MLSQTKGGNWAKEITITRGGKYKEVAKAQATEAEAWALLQPHQQRGRKCTVRVTPTGKFLPLAYMSRTRQVMTHASAAECRDAGREPGPCN